MKQNACYAKTKAGKPCRAPMVERVKVKAIDYLPSTPRVSGRRIVQLCNAHSFAVDRGSTVYVTVDGEEIMKLATQHGDRGHRVVEEWLLRPVGAP